MQETAMKTKTSNKQKQKWMTDEISRLMDDRRKQKNKNAAEYNAINKEGKRAQ